MIFLAVGLKIIGMLCLVYYGKTNQTADIRGREELADESAALTIEHQKKPRKSSEA